MNTPARRNLVPNGARQRGLTLIELLVSMAIAVFLLGGLLTIVGNTRRTFGAQNLMAQLQDNQRLTMTLIGDVIQEAGYFPDPTTNVSAAVLPVVAGTFPTAGQSITGTYAAATPGDSITVRFATAPNDGVINCIGGTNKTAVNPLVYVNAFSIDASGNLICKLTANGVTTQATLVSGIQNLRVLYGVITNPALGNGAVDTYLRADQMTATNWTNVVSVQVTVTFVNPLAGQPGQPATIPFQRVVGVMNRTGVKI
jgi:type IV pilus assembly protein PilW